MLKAVNHSNDEKNDPQIKEKGRLRLSGKKRYIMTFSAKSCNGFRYRT